MNRAQKMLMLALNSQSVSETVVEKSKIDEGLKVYSVMSPMKIVTSSEAESTRSKLSQTPHHSPSPVNEHLQDINMQEPTTEDKSYLPSTSQGFRREFQERRNIEIDLAMNVTEQENDFDSDDDVADPSFHLNSTSCSRSESEVSEETKRAGLLLEKKLKGDVEKRKQRKYKKNTGQEYVNNSGKTIQEKAVKELEPCRMKCGEKISKKAQNDIFEQYWKLGSYNLRAAFASGLILISEKKSEKKLTKNLRSRTHANSFFLEVRGERVKVCQKCFRFTLCETEQFIKTVVKKKLESPGTAICQDRRGRKTPPNKLTDSVAEEIRNHILSFPAYESHYTRKQSAQKYLHADLSLSQMYQLYSENFGRKVSVATYSKIFKSMNIKFKKPQLDTCNKCETLNMKIKSFVGSEQIKFKKELEDHQKDSDLAYESKKNDKVRGQNSQGLKVFTFDLQQCLPTPFLRTNVSFYKRQLWTFNLTIHDGVTNQPYCYMWHEGDANRGGNEIASCIFEHLKGLPENAKEVIFYSDCCGGQNKNSFVATMFLLFMQTESNVEIIDHKFLLPGHTHMECDSDHAAIEKKKKRTSVNIHHPRDWYQFVRSVRTNKPFIVAEMVRDKFLDFSRTAKEKFMWRKVDENGKKFLWQEVKWVRYEKKFGTIKFKTSLSEEEPFQVLNLRRRGISRANISDVPICYTEPQNISKEKKKDLLDILPLIDVHYHSFYENLPTENKPDYHPDLTEQSDIEI